MDDTHDVLTTKEAAERIRCSEATIHRMVKRGDLEGVLRPGFGRITRKSVEAFLRSGSQAAGEDSDG